jgi:ATP phosphoribosyltransferase
MLGLPKGSLEESTKNLFAKAGWKITTSSRSYKPSIDDPELDGRFVRAQEVSRYVEHGFFDCGLTGHDWVLENNSDVVEVCDLVYSRASTLKSRWVLCVPESSPVKTIADLAGKRIATELMNTTKRFFAEKGVAAEIEFSWGATEVKVPDLVDAIVDITETGSSLRANNLRIVDTLLYTNTKFIANKASWANPARARSKPCSRPCPPCATRRFPRSARPIGSPWRRSSTRAWSAKSFLSSKSSGPKVSSSIRSTRSFTKRFRPCPSPRL